MKRVARISFSLLLTVVFLALFASGFDLAAAGRSLRAASPALIALSILVNLSAYLIRAWRWRYLLGPVRKSLGMYNLTSTTFIGFMVSFVVPFRLGEVVRPVLLARRERLSAGSALATIAVERLMDLLVVIGLFLLFVLSSSGSELLASTGEGASGAASYLRRGLSAAAWSALMGLPLIGLLVIAPGRVVALLHRLNPGHPTGPVGRAIGLLERFAAGLRVLRGGRDLLASLLLSLAMWLVIDLSILIGVRAVGLDLGFADMFLLMVALVAGIAVPTPGGVGPFEFLVQVSLTDFWGGAGGGAAPTAITLHAITLVPTIAVGLLFMWRDGLRWREVRGLARSGGAVSATGGRT
ncbi:MAG: lysylphosphatidylglycerol synthase transmembrane domain-containing protein [Acidobacteriota bacterium]